MTDISKMYGDTIKVPQLYYARAATDLGSFSGAAAALGVTQPALSTGIAALERTLGGALFERSTTGVAPTALAGRLYPHLMAVLEALEALMAQARVATGLLAEPLRVGVSPLVQLSLVARAFEAARRQSSATLVLTEDNLAGLQTSLMSRHLDVIFVPAVGGAQGCARRRVDTEAIHYLPSGPSPMTSRSVELADLSGRTLVMVGEACGLTRFTRSIFAESGLTLDAYPGEADTYRSLEDWARLGLGGVLLPQSKFRADEKTWPVLERGLPVQIHYEAVWLGQSARAPAIEALLDSVGRVDRSPPSLT